MDASTEIDPVLVARSLTHHPTCRVNPSSPPERPSSSSEEFDFYALKCAAPKTCPFADGSRENPCLEFARPRSRKDSIMKHLNKMNASNPEDLCHPLDDPLWNSNIVKYMMVPRPAKYPDSERKKGSRKSNRKCYVKRIKRQEDHEAQYRAQFQRGEITAAEMNEGTDWT